MSVGIRFDKNSEAKQTKMNKMNWNIQEEEKYQLVKRKGGESP